MNCHILLKYNMHDQSSPKSIWQSMPSAESWSAADMVQQGTLCFETKGFVLLGGLCESIQQGVSARTIKDGELQVGFLRSADIAPPSEAVGNITAVADKLAKRLLRPGDVLMPRVGATGRADYVGSVSRPLLAGQELMTLRLKNPQYAPLIAAALSSKNVKAQITGLMAGSTIPTLTRDAIGRILVPDPQQPKAYHLLEELKASKASIAEAESALATTRANVDRIFENAPSDISADNFQWVTTHRMPPDWGWQNVLHHSVIKDGQNRLQAVARLGELPHLNLQRGGFLKAPAQLKRLSTSGFRTQWHLALLESVENESGAQTKAGLVLDRKALLVPMVGNIESAPIVIDEDLIEQASGAIVVPVHWGVITDFDWLRSLAVVLDHPFVRLQRRLAGVASTVPHLPIEALKDLILPAVAASQWAQWETTMETIHSKLFSAAGVYATVSDGIEAWYHDATC